MRKIEDGMGEKIATIIFSISSAVCMIIMTFIKGWKLTLICLAALPLPIVAYTVGEMVRIFFIVTSLISRNCPSRKTLAYF